MTGSEKLEEAAALARGGSAKAAEDLAALIQADVFRLALRILGNFEEAEEAAQDAVLLVLAKLAGFEGRSSFSTWYRRVAANRILSAKRRRGSGPEISFEDYEASLDLAAARSWSGSPSGPEESMLYEETRRSCLQGLLLCLDRDHRAAFVLADSFGCGGAEGAEILGITPQAFRKRLSRARSRLAAFLEKNCGCFGRKDACSCGYHASRALGGGPFDPGSARLTPRGASFPSVEKIEAEMRALDALAVQYRWDPAEPLPPSFADKIRAAIGSGSYVLTEAVRGGPHG